MLFYNIFFDLHRLNFREYASSDNVENAATALDAAPNHAQQFDNLPEAVVNTSFFVKGHELRMSETSKDFKESCVECIIQEFESSLFSGIDQYADIVKKYRITE